MPRYKDSKRALEHAEQTAKQFAQTLDWIALAIEGDMEAIVKKVCIDIFSRIAERTPIDTGRARANWNISFGSEPPTEEESFGGFDDIKKSKKKGKTGRSQQVAQVLRNKIDGFDFDLTDEYIIIYNNVHYIEYLENGTSRQAPAGMVAVTLTEFDYHLSNEVRKYDWADEAFM